MAGSGLKMADNGSEVAESGLKMAESGQTRTAPAISSNNSTASSIEFTPSTLRRRVFLTSLILVRRGLDWTKLSTCLNILLSKYGDCWLAIK